MLHRELRTQVAEVARRCAQTGLTQGTAGNVSVRDPDSGHVLITPTGVPYESLEPAQVVVLDPHGQVIEGTLKPSSETPMHTFTYKDQRWANGLVHTHSPYATAFACANEPIRAVHYLIAFAGKEVPVANYATYGTPQLAREVLAVLRPDTKAVLLKHHGVLAAGTTLEEAYTVAEAVEYVAKIQYLALQIGKPTALPEEEMELLVTKFKSYGQQRT